MHFFALSDMVLKMPVCESHKAARQLLLLLQGKGNHLQNGVLLHLFHLIALTCVLKAPKPQQKKAKKLLMGISLDCSLYYENVGV